LAEFFKLGTSKRLIKIDAIDNALNEDLDLLDR
jgi:hypothetical protein